MVSQKHLLVTFFSLEIEISTNTTLHFSLEVLIAQTVPSASACHKEEWKLEMRNQDNKKKSRQRPVVNMVKISKILKDRVEKSVKLDLEWDSEGTSEQDWFGGVAGTNSRISEPRSEHTGLVMGEADR